MAQLDPYAELDEYRARNRVTGERDSLAVAELLTLNSRRLEKMLHVAPGYFNTHAATYVFDAYGGSVLDLRDRAGMAYCLTAITADSLALDTDGDGSYDDYTLDLDDAWVRGLPENAASQSEPFMSLELLPLTSATITTWPDAPASVQIAGTWGWATRPPAVREVVIALTRDLRETHLAGATMQLQGPDGEVFDVRPDTFSRFMALASLYGRRGVVFA